MRTLLVALCAVCLSSCSGGKTDPQGGGGDSSAVSARHRDYFAIFEFQYDSVAVLTLSQTWLGEYGRHAVLKDGSVAAVADGADGAADVNDRMIVDLTKEFVKTHGIDPKDHKAAFVKAYPERDVVMQEVEVRTRELAKKQMLDASGHLLMYLTANREAATREYRNEYLRKHARGWVEDAQKKARQLPGMVALRQKVTGK